MNYSHDSVCPNCGYNYTTEIPATLVTCPFCIHQYREYYIDTPKLTHYWETSAEATVSGNNLFLTTCPECQQDFCHN